MSVGVCCDMLVRHNVAGGTDKAVHVTKRKRTPTVLQLIKRNMGERAWKALDPEDRAMVREISRIRNCGGPIGSCADATERR